MLEPTILYEDESIIVVEKPSGMTVNKADTTKDEVTLQDWVEKKFGIKNSELRIEKKNEIGTYNPEYEFYSRGGIVHRLDKETSGIILVAKNVESFVKLQKQFKERTIKKTYIALAHGKITPMTGEITVPVGRLPFNRKRFGVVAGGREALTKYKIIKNLELNIKNKKEPVTLLELYPRTGRTHQIRVHLKYINHPIFSDLLYAGRKTARNDRKLLTRLFLHASSITFIHPQSGKEIRFESRLPNDLQDFLKSC